jgi:SAM-dependent methyltransferase
MPNGRHETNPKALHAAIVRKNAQRVSATGEMTFPAVPSLVDHYVNMIARSFSALQRPLEEEQREDFRKVLLEKLEWGFRRSPYSTVTVRFETDKAPDVSVSWELWASESSMEEQYQYWVETREPPLFGVHPDARLMTLAQSLGAPREVTCLDVGAGTGRNTMPLARAGFPVDAVEPAGPLADQLDASIADEGLEARVVRGDFLSPLTVLPRPKYRLIVLSEVCSHFRDVNALRRMFRRLTDTLESGGHALFNVFLAKDGYVPDKLVREMSEVAWGMLFTRAELADALGSAPLRLVADDDVLTYERDRQPEWPPTPWYETWVTGRDLFDAEEDFSPLEMRWLVYRRN